jgi:hypothetical protein
MLGAAVDLPQHVDPARPGASDPPRSRSAARRKRAALWVAPELPDPVGSLEVGKREDVEEFGAASGAEGVETLSESALKLVRPYARRLRCERLERKHRRHEPVG